MKYTKFYIKNFKWISELEIDLLRKPAWNVFPLVWLNESGKTTILQAINLFEEWLEWWKEHEVIHKQDSWWFTGEIIIKATLELEDIDRIYIKERLDSKGYELKDGIGWLSLEKKYKFINSRISGTKPSLTWIWEKWLNVKTVRQKSYRRLLDFDESLWNEITTGLQDSFPKILYFPDFLFDFPNQIYLENIAILNSDKERELQTEYRQIIDDVLRAINPNYSVTDFLTKLKAFSDPSQQAASTTIKQQISSILNQKIVTPWQEIFRWPNKNIIVETWNDSTWFYIQLKVSEWASPFLVNERSLWFRWFFGFILFTEFRKSRVDESGEYLFLFDEPASNLHENSQQKLLCLFDKLIDRAKIIYSTHSPYLLNSKYILTSYVAKDIGRESYDDFNFRQDIKAIPYKQFVASYPEETTHFKPILDVLEFNTTDFDLEDKIVFFEWKFDYYTFGWVLEVIFGSEDYEFKLYPWASVDKYDWIFREYIAHNKNFIAVFDADGTDTTKWKWARNRYIKEISEELNKNIFTLFHIDPSFDWFTTESLFSDTEKLVIQQISFPTDTAFIKSNFNVAIQELFITQQSFSLSNETKDKFKKIFEFIKQKFTEL